MPMCVFYFLVLHNPGELSRFFSIIWEIIAVELIAIIQRTSGQPISLSSHSLVVSTTTAELTLYVSWPRLRRIPHRTSNTSHSRTVPSAELDARRNPEGSNRHPYTTPLCPRRVYLCKQTTVCQLLVVIALQFPANAQRSITNDEKTTERAVKPLLVRWRQDSASHAA